jgi:hypothetical protein
MIAVSMPPMPLIAGQLLARAAGLSALFLETPVRSSPS